MTDKERFKENAQKMDDYEGYLPKQQDKQPKTRKMKPITYGIRLETEDALQQVIDEMRKASHTIDSFFDEVESHPEFKTEGYMFENYVHAIAACILNRTPKLQSKENIQTQFTMTSNRVSVRLEGGIKFEIIAPYEIKSNTAEITAIIGEITLYSPNNDLKIYLKNSNWNQVQF